MILDDLRQDIKYAVRGIRSRPAFTLAVVATLGLGLGANSAMFGIVDGLLFRPPALMKDPATAHRLYAYQTYRGKERAAGGGQFARYQDFARWTTTCSLIAGYTQRDLAVGVGDAAREMHIGVISANFFDFFDIPPALGRYFKAGEDLPPAGQPVAVLSYTMWKTQYGLRDVRGEKIQVGPIIYTVIGVTPRGFVGLWPDKPPAVFIPITSYASGAAPQRLAGNWPTTYSWNWMSTLVRRKPGVTVAQANADLSHAFYRSYEAQVVEQTRSTPIDLAKPRAEIGSVLSERGPNESSVAKVATWVGGVSLVVLLIACANVANLLLARALRRRREIALRIALGVTRSRLFAQLLTESVLLAVMGGAAGVVIATWGGAVLRRTLLDKSEAAAGFRDPRTVLFTFGAALVVGVLMGLAPMIQATRVDLTSDLKSGEREGSFRRSRTGVVLLVLQGALSVVLLVGAGLFVRSVRNIDAIPLGYDVDPVLIVNVNMRGTTLDSAQTVALRHRLLDAARTTPGVENASLQVGVPFWSSWSVGMYVDGIDTVSNLGSFELNAVSPSFFQTVGTHVLRGRGITDADIEGSTKSVVVSEGMGKALWPGADPVGQCIRFSSTTGPCAYVVGVAQDIRAGSLHVDSTYYYYLAAAQFNPQVGGLFVRVRGGKKMLETVRVRLQREMPGASYVAITPMSDILESQTRSWHLGATMFVVFGVLALVLAAIGLYSVIAYNVAQRAHELAVRVALGAEARNIVRLVVGEGFRIAVVGVAVGAVAALWIAKWLKPLLFDVAPRDPAVLAFVTVVLLGVAVAASAIPALRASRTDPNAALRSD